MFAARRTEAQQARLLDAAEQAQRLHAAEQLGRRCGALGLADDGLFLLRRRVDLCVAQASVRHDAREAKLAPETAGRVSTHR